MAKQATKNDTPQPAQGPESVAADQRQVAGENGKAAADQEMVHLIVFKLGAEHYAIRIEQVKEVTVTPSVTRMPRTPDFVKGVANIRGDILAIMDLEERFGLLPALPAGAEEPKVTYTLVIEAKEYSIGVLVKEMPQSLNLPVSRIDKAPAFLQDSKISDNYIVGIAHTDNRLIIVLDMFKVLSGEEIKLLAHEGVKHKT